MNITLRSSCRCSSQSRRPPVAASPSARSPKNGVRYGTTAFGTGADEDGVDSPSTAI
jgi:hypothetical protein